VRAATLALLAEGPQNGYQIIQQIGERSGGVWRPSSGSVYPGLQLLEDEGLIRAEEAAGRRVFALTEAGRAHVEGRKEELARVWGTVAGRVDGAALELRDLFEQVGAAVAQVARAGADAEVAEALRLLIETRRRLYRILAGPQGDDGPDGGPRGAAGGAR
jgi:DNA-binding PadR family transcriptional regulator